MKEHAVKYYNHAYRSIQISKPCYWDQKRTFRRHFFNYNKKETGEKISLRYELRAFPSLFPFPFPFCIFTNRSCRGCFVLLLFAASSASSQAAASASSEIPKTPISAPWFWGLCTMHLVQPIRQVSSLSPLAKHTPHPHQTLKLDHLR